MTSPVLRSWALSSYEGRHRQLTLQQPREAGGLLAPLDGWKEGGSESQGGLRLEGFRNQKEYVW